MARKHGTRRRLLAAAVFLVVIAAGAADYFYSQLPQRTDSYVADVVDGDTLTIQGGERVRLLYIDTPERGEDCYVEAKQRLTELVDKKDIVLERTGEDRDRYGRLLRYVFADGVMINLVLVEEGYAHMYVFDRGPYHDLFLQAEQKARQENGCVWK